MACNKLSLVCSASGPKARSAHSFNSSMKFENEFLLRSKVSFCYLCLAEAWDCGLAYFRWNMMSFCSGFQLLLVILFLKVCKAYLLRCEWNWLIFMASYLSSWILSIYWKRSLKSSNFSFLPWKIIVFVVVGLKNADDILGRCWDAIPVFVSASFLIGLAEFEFCLYSVCSTIGNVLSVGKCVVVFCSWENYCDKRFFEFEIGLWDTQENCFVRRYVLSPCDEHALSGQNQVLMTKRRCLQIFIFTSLIVPV